MSLRHGSFIIQNGKYLTWMTYFKMAATAMAVEDQVNKLLAAVVPEIFDGDEDRDPESELILPLKRILTNGEVELSEEEDSPSTRCGKTLDVQEVAYCCRYRSLARVRNYFRFCKDSCLFASE